MVSASCASISDMRKAVASNFSSWAAMKRSTSMRTNIASPTALDSCSLTALIASSSTLAMSRGHAVHPLAGLEQLRLEIDESLRQRAHRVVEPGAEAAERCLEVGELHAVVLVDPLFHRQGPVDHLHVDRVDALREDLAVLGELTSQVGARSDRPARARHRCAARSSSRTT